MKRCRRKLLILTVLGSCCLLLLGLAITLRYGNTQWNRSIYIFQAYYWPKKGKTNWPSRGVFIEPPKTYRGTWRTWWPDGCLWWEGYFENGTPKGKHNYWPENGGPMQVIMFP